MAVVLFAIQLLLCFMAKKTVVKMIPSFFIALYAAFILLICTGIFGKGSGFVGDVQLIVAAILAIVLSVALIGIIAACIVYCIYAKAKKSQS